MFDRNIDEALTDVAKETERDRHDAIDRLVQLASRNLQIAFSFRSPETQPRRFKDNNVRTNV